LSFIVSPATTKSFNTPTIPNTVLFSICIEYDHVFFCIYFLVFTGLAGSVWTENVKRAHRVAQSIRTGMIWVNCWLKRDLRVPFGGVGDSGIGREGGMHSLEFYSELKNICIQL
jgi:hypothetical protein